MSDNSGGGYSSVGQPPNTPGLPQNPIPTVFQGFTGLNTKAAQQGIADQEMFVCDGFMPLGPNNLRVLRDLGGVIYTAPGGRTINNFDFGNIGAMPICLVCLDNGSLVQVNMLTLATTQIGVSGTITGFSPDFSQWSSLYQIIVAPQTNGYFLWDGSNLFQAGTVGPEVTIDNGGSGYTSAPTVTLQGGVQATGTLTFNSNPSPGDTITLNGVLWTFVASGATGNQFNIGGTTGVTIAVNTLPVLNASVNPAIDVASYGASGGPTVVVMSITYKSGGPAGNAYTLAASAATPSAGTLTGGSGGTGFGATFSAQVANASVVSITVTNPGSNFSITDTPILTITGGGSDDMARATANISDKAGVSSVIVNKGGTGYSALVGVIASSGGASAQATFSVVGSNGVITQVVVQNPGLGYTGAPTLTIVDITGSIGTGAVLTPVLAGGQIGSATLNTPGSGYTTPPTLTVIGDGLGAVLSANLTGSLVGSISVISPGVGYTEAEVQFNGGNRGAAATATLMPFGVGGSTVETYESRVWVGNGRNGQVSSPGDPADFDAANGSTAFESTDSFLKVAYQKFLQSNGFLYLLGDSSMNYISGVSTAGNPAITTFNNLNVDPQIGTPWPATVQAFGRDIVFANPIGVYVSYGGAVTKVSDALDGIYSTVTQADWPAGFTPSAAVMTIFGIQVYILLMPILDQVTGNQVTKCLMWDGKKWWTSPQTGITLGFAASQEINSVLTAYCSPDGATIRPMFTTPTDASTMTKYLYSKLWDNPGVFTTKMVRRWFALINVNLNSLPTSASGTITFNANPSPGDTITLNGAIFTFVASGADSTNYEFNILISLAATLVEALFNLPPDAYTGDARINVASYSLASGNTALLVTYNTTGAAGNAYTLAASVATPSGPTLTGGGDAEEILIAPITENGVGTEVEFIPSVTGPVIIGPIVASNPGKVLGVRIKTVTQDIQINSVTLFNQIMQSNV